MKKRLCYLLVLLVSIGVSHKLSSQDKIYFPYFEMINVENAAGIQLSTSKLLKTYIEESHNYIILLPKHDYQQVFPREDFLESVENARQLGAKYFLSGEINNIGKLAILSLTLYEVSSGNKVWSDLIKGLPLDDYDPVLSRIGRNFKTSVKAGNDAGLYDVTAFEEQREMKLLNFQSNHFVGLGLGGSYLMYESMNTRVEIDFYYDISSVILYMDFEYSSNTMFNFILNHDWRDNSIRKNKTAGFGMGVNIPFTKTKNALYADAGLKLGLITQKGGNPPIDLKGSGLGFSAGLGYLIGRNSTSNVRFQTGIMLPAYKSGNKYIPVLEFGIITSFASSSR